MQRGFIPIIVLISVLVVSSVGVVGVLYLNKSIPHSILSNKSNEKFTFSPNQSTPSAKSNSQSVSKHLSAFEILLGRGRVTPFPTPSPIAPVPIIKSPTATYNTLIKTGTLKGKVAGGYYLKILPDTTVTLKGEKISKTTKSDSNGIFTFSGVPVGNYNLSFSHPDYNISDVDNVTVSEGETFYHRTINGFLKVVKLTTFKGIVYVDRNDNRQQDVGEEGLDALIEVYNRIGDGWSLNHNINADQSGSFTFEVTEDGITFKFVPTEYTFYRKPAPVEFVVEGYGGTKELSFPYYPTASTSKITIYVFNDKNENSIQDADEENIYFYYADITDTSTGKNEKTSVVPEGAVLNNYDYGAYKVKLIPGNIAWSTAYKITKLEDILIITNNSGDQTVRLGAHKLN